jgi:glycosyltransferase involved in cell wall biosynthesis
MIAEDFPPFCAGVGYYVYHLSRKLSQKGHQIVIMTRGSWKGTVRQESDGLTVYRVRFIRSYPFHVQPHAFFVNRLLKSMESELDLIHIHGPMAPLVHTSLPILLTQHGTAKATIDNLELLDLFSFVAKAFVWMYASLDRRVAYSARKVTAVSDSCAAEIRQYYGIKEVVTIGNGVDTSFFVPRDASDDRPREMRAVYAGILSTRKGLPDLVKSAPYVLREIPEVKFLVAGTGPLRGYLIKLVRQLHLEESFSFPGYLDRNQLREYYQNASLVVLPSYHEGLPNVLLEAMSCGVPVVATAIPGTTEAVVDGEVGILVPPHNPERLAEAIVRLLRDPQLRRELGNRGRKRAETLYDWEIVANRVEEIYFSLLEKK